MRKTLSEELQRLEKDIERMGMLCLEALTKSVEALVKRDAKLAKSVIERDDEIDRLELKIEHECMRIIALQQPAGSDLRVVGACLKMVTDLERIGDLSVDIAEVTMEYIRGPPVKPLIDIPRMAEIAKGMLLDCSKAFINRDSKLAREIGNRDDMVDALCLQVIRELMYLSVTNPRVMKGALELMFIASFLERVADHATNIAERIIYMVEGKLVKIN